MSLQVNVRAIVKEKNPRLYRKVPAFFFSWLERLICQDQINEILEKYGSLQGVEFVERVLEHLSLRCEFSGLDHIRKDQSYIFASNHPLGGLDAFAIILALAPMGEMRFVVNDILMQLEPLQPLFTPVNKHGTQQKGYVTQLNTILSKEINVVYFPAGLCSRMVDGRITDPIWKKGFVQKAFDTNRAIVPVYVENINSRYFYRVAWFRRQLGIKLNIEMLLLPGELFKKRGTEPIRVIFGEPILIEELQECRDTISRCVAYVREKCYNLKKEQK